MSEPTQTQTEKPDVNDLQRRYFPPSQLERATTAIEEARTIAEQNDLPIHFNWNATEESLPNGYGVAILPIMQRREGFGNVPVGLHIAGIPDPETILEYGDKGEKYVRDKIVASLMNHYANTVRPKEGTSQPLSIPYSIEDFILSSSRDQGLAFFREYGPQYVRQLKKAGLSIMNMTLLRQILSSASFAKQQYPNIAQEKWEGLLDKMIERAKNDPDHEPGIVEVWRQTRDETELQMGDFDLEDLDNLV